MKCKRVLIVDDHRDSAKMLAAALTLRTADLGVRVAFDGVSGLALALAGEHDAVILDLGLPDVGGADIATQIRRQQGGASPLLIALSGNVEDVALLQGGVLFDHTFTKPANVDRLTAILFQDD